MNHCSCWWHYREPVQSELFYAHFSQSFSSCLKDNVAIKMPWSSSFLLILLFFITCSPLSRVLLLFLSHFRCHIFRSLTTALRAYSSACCFPLCHPDKISSTLEAQKAARAAGLSWSTDLGLACSLGSEQFMRPCCWKTVQRSCAAVILLTWI